MPNPLEDRVFEFILKHRVLKLVFFTITAVGIVASAYTAAKPILDSAYMPLARLFNISASREFKDKYGCAYKAGTIAWLVADEMGNLTHPLEIDADVLNSHQRAFIRCQALFGQTSSQIPYEIPINETPGPTSTKSRAIDSTIRNSASFEGQLLKEDRVGYRLFQLSSKIRFLRGMLDAQLKSGIDGQMALTAGESRTVISILQLQSESQDLLPYRLPSADIETTNKLKCFTSLINFEEKYTEYFAAGA
jgi:hypothetical protein